MKSYKRLDLWLPEVEWAGEGGGWQELNKGSQRYKISVMNIIYNMINILNIAVYYIWKLIRG